MRDLLRRIERLQGEHQSQDVDTNDTLRDTLLAQGLDPDTVLTPDGEVVIDGGQYLAVLRAVVET